MSSAPPDATSAPARPRLLIVAGEASGDRYAAGLIRSLRQMRPELVAFGVGGELMSREGVDLLYDMRHLAVVGITEVVAHLGDVRRAMKLLVRAAVEREADAVVLVDYPDFNLALARRLRRVRPSLPIVYYISPQIWAWRAGRVKTIARLVDRMLVILPFEAELYEAAGVDVEFVGHPLLDDRPALTPRSDFATRHGLDQDAEWIGLLPGSRRTEVRRLMPPMLAAAARLQRGPGTGSREFLVPVAGGVDRTVYNAAMGRIPQELDGVVHLVADQYHDAVHHCRAAAVCSGTATLEVALLETPEVVVYKTSWLTYNLGKLLVHIDMIALVNVVAGRRVVPELLQHEVTGRRIARELEPLLQEGPEREEARRFLRQVRQRLGEPGATERAARSVVAVIEGTEAAPTSARDTPA